MEYLIVALLIVAILVETYVFWRMNKHIHDLIVIVLYHQSEIEKLKGETDNG